MIGWNIPSNNDGLIVGFNDAGIESFTGNKIASLSREIIQNSCDARQDVTKPVRVTFQLKELATKEFPDAHELQSIFQACRDYWETNKKVRSFFTQAHDSFSSPAIPVLVISDYNTTGLTGANSKGFGAWDSLTKATGASDKPSHSGGSFGIGKNAPFACSNCRTVFYLTKDETGQEAFQGVTKLVTHLNKQGETTQGTGYYGYKKGNLPLLSLKDLPPLFQRTDTGTDLFVMGFNQGIDWKTDVIKSVLENFLIAIYENHLEVEVEGTVINQHTLQALLNTYIKHDSDCLSYMYHKALVSNQKIFVSTTSLPCQSDLGEIELHMVFGENLPKRVAMVRSTGMKIIDKHFRTPHPYAAILLIKGDRANQILRAMENPQHNNWEPDRYEENVRFAKRFLKDLFAWTSNRIKEQVQEQETEEMDLAGLNQFLPDEIDEDYAADQSADPEQSKTEIEQTIEVMERTFEMSDRAKGLQLSETEEPLLEGDTGSQDTPKPEPTDTITPNKNGPLKEGQTADTGKAIYVKKQIPIGNVRVFCKNRRKGEYHVSFSPEKTGSGMLCVYISGEDRNEAAPVKEAVLQQGVTHQGLDFSKGRSEPIHFQEGEKLSFSVFLKSNLRCALEVTLRED